MSDTDPAATPSPDRMGATAPASGSTVSVTFKFAQPWRLVTGDRITNFPSAVKQNGPIVIDPLPTGLDRAAQQAAINRRASDLAIIAQALGLASSLLEDAIATLDAQSE